MKYKDIKFRVLTLVVEVSCFICGYIIGAFIGGLARGILR